jgi:hypothetical protein
MAYRLICPELKSWLSRVKQFIDLFGVINPTALWDLIPFSFVVDWFFGFGKWLQRNRPRLFKGSVVVYDYCESIRLQYTHEYYAAADIWVDQTNPAGYPVNSVGTERCVTYIRRRYQPAVGGLTLGSSHPLLSIREAVIASGLVAQRIPRPGNIGDLFEGIDFGQDSLPVNGTTAAMEHSANRAWALQMRQRKAALSGGVYPSLRKFELKPSHVSPGSDLGLKLPRYTPYRGKLSQVVFVPMRKYRAIR